MGGCANPMGDYRGFYFFICIFLCIYFCLRQVGVVLATAWRHLGVVLASPWRHLDHHQADSTP